jgi:simple sugar transport system permease protein
MNKRVVNEILTSVVALVLALAVAGLAVLLAGHNPLVAVQALLHGAFGSAENIGDTINRTTPLILTGLAVAFAFRSGLFNIGGEGQYLLGGMGAVAAAIAFPHLSPFLLVPLSLICGAAAGAIWGALAAWLKSRFGVHEVISTIMLPGDRDLSQRPGGGRRHLQSAPHGCRAPLDRHQHLHRHLRGSGVGRAGLVHLETHLGRV